MIFFEHALKRSFKQKFMITTIMLIPISLVFLPQAAGELPLGFTMYGLFILFTAFLLTKQIIDDRIQKTVVRIAASPIDHKQYLSGHLLAYLSILIVQNSLFVIVALFTWSSIEISVPLMLLTYIMFSVLSIAFSLFWHMFFKSYATSVAVFSVIANILAVLGGLMFPLSVLPETLKTIGVIIPTYWFSSGLDALYQGEPSQAIIALFIILGFAIIFIGIGSRRRLE